MKKLGSITILAIITFTSACSTTVGNVSKPISTEIYPVNSEPRQYRNIENSLSRYQQYAEQMVNEGYSSFLIYMSFNAYTGVNAQDRRAALHQLSTYLCFGPDYTSSIRSSANHSGNYWDPGRHGINHIEAQITCLGKQPEMVARQNQLKLSAAEQQRASQARVTEQRAREKQAEALREQAASQASREALCLSFGFKSDTDYFSKCLFELYKIEQQSKQTDALIAERKAQNKAQEAAQLESLSLQRQALDEQRFQQGIQQMQDAARILNPPRTTTRCRWNNITKTMICD
jgi:hypothetical protein